MVYWLGVADQTSDHVYLYYFLYCLVGLLLIFKMLYTRTALTFYISILVNLGKFPLKCLALFSPQSMATKGSDDVKR